MKKLITMLLALMMVLSLAACGGGNAQSTESQDNNSEQTVQEVQTESKENTEENVPTEEPEEGTTDITEYAIGDAFGTDSIECIITEVKWITEDDLTSYSLAKTTRGLGALAEKLYPDYWFRGIKDHDVKLTDFPYLFVTFTLQNVGKTVIEADMTATSYIPYGNIQVAYDDGYLFDSNLGFISKLEVLGDASKEGRFFTLPSQVSENEDKPLYLKVLLPNSAGETEEFYVKVR